ncbi:MAG TPA: PHP domain-containing protein [Deltaproteobacteria bacterium]|nr:PHP domain-containing protein [Deltaproteobacteria bacterium]
MRTVADLHTHSCVSDGNLSPAELVDLAASRGLRALALTDHDTLAGIPPAMRSAGARGIRLIPGIEISAEFEPGMLHLLGYFPSHPPGMEAALEHVQRARNERIPRIISRLNGLGVRLDVSDVAPGVRQTQVGRPHVARALVKKGYVHSFDEAFDRYLGRGRQAYVPKEKLSWMSAIGLIRRHGGLPVLAHPCTLDLDESDLGSFVERLSSEGLAGMEVHYPDHTPEQVSLYTGIASALHLVVTGGSDYHGPERNGCSPGDYGMDRNQFDLFCKHLTA